MDISNQVTDGYKMKRGNYAVSVNDRAGDGHSVGITITRIITKNYTRSSHVLNGQGAEGGICNSSIHNRQKRTTMCQAHSLQGEPIQRGLTQQIEWARGTWQLLWAKPGWSLLKQTEHAHKYVLHRYGTWCKAFEFHQERNWY